MDALKIDNLHKSLGKNTIINGLSMSIPENTIFGFLGKNGAGKTTTMKMILGFFWSVKNQSIYRVSSRCS